MKSYNIKQQIIDILTSEYPATADRAEGSEVGNNTITIRVESKNDEFEQMPSNTYFAETSYTIHIYSQNESSIRMDRNLDKVDNFIIHYINSVNVEVDLMKLVSIDKGEYQEGEVDYNQPGKYPEIHIQQVHMLATYREFTG